MLRRMYKRRWLRLCFTNTEHQTSHSHPPFSFTSNINYHVFFACHQKGRPSSKRILPLERTSNRYAKGKQRKFHLLESHDRPLRLHAIQGTHTPLLFKPLTLRGVTFKNRIWVVSFIRLLSLVSYLYSPSP